MFTTYRTLYPIFERTAYLSVTAVINELIKPTHSYLTQQELEFERGVWSAAMDGEEGKVRRRLAEGTSPNATDSAGYTPLVIK